MKKQRKFSKLKMKCLEAFRFGVLLIIVYASLMGLFVLHTAYGYDGKPIPIQTVAGIDVHEATKAMRKAEKEEKAQQEAKKKKRLKEADIDLMAHLVYAENGNDAYAEYYKAMLYTGSVALNRVRSKKYPNNLYDVVYQRGQYACTWDGNIEKTPSKDAYEVAEYLIENGSVIPSKVLYASEFLQGHVYDKVAGTYYCY